MGWSYCGTDSDGRDIGYSIEATCDEPDCTEEIDRGLGYCCGGMHGGGEQGCGKYFCGKHLFYGYGAQLCRECIDRQEKYEAELLAQLKTARGARFTELFREADVTIGERLRREVRTKRVVDGTLPIRYFGELATREGLALKTLFRMLEDGQTLPTGTYEQMLARGIKPSQVLQAK